MLEDHENLYHEMSRSLDSLMRNIKIKQYEDPEPEMFWEMSQIPTRKGRQCYRPDCSNAHENRMAPGERKEKLRDLLLFREMPA